MEKGNDLCDYCLFQYIGQAESVVPSLGRNNKGIDIQRDCKDYDKGE